jgi:hypothetical protein
MTTFKFRSFAGICKQILKQGRSLFEVLVAVTEECDFLGCDTL